jgi:peptidoglycan hydrolase-like protein with peptidoglycan-binding domain
LPSGGGSTLPSGGGSTLPSSPVVPSVPQVPIIPGVPQVPVIPVSTEIPREIGVRMATALASGDPKTIRAEAAKLRKEGWEAQAQDLEKAAGIIESLLSQPAAPTPPPKNYPAEPAHVPAELRGVTLKQVKAPEPFDPRVVLWQNRLKQLGYRTSTTVSDGKFGPNTHTQTKAFQLKLGMSRNGVADPRMISAAYLSTAPTATGATPAPAPVAVPAKPPTPAPVVVLPSAPAYPAEPKHVPPSLRGVTLRKVPAPEAFDARVVLWQDQLKALGHRSASTKSDGKFGLNTESQTKAAQTKLKLAPSGLADPKTISAAYTKQPAVIAAPAPVLPAGSASSVPSLLANVTLRKVPDSQPADARVTAWQDQLKKLGYRSSTTKSDGKFGTNTEAQTKQLQTARGLDATGIADPITIATAFGAPIRTTPTAAAPAVAAAVPPPKVDPSKWRALIRRGDNGSDVREWQMVLLSAGYKVVVDGAFGAETESSTRGWQTEKGLKADGIVGNDVKGALQKQGNVTMVAGDTAASIPFELLARPPAFSSLTGVDWWTPIARDIPADLEPAKPAPEPGQPHALALELAEHLRNVKPGQEDRELVKTFQRSLGLNDSGAYGPATAQALVSFSVVPPRPFYWPSKKLLRAQTRYKMALREQARRDPARADQWISASNV